MKLRTLIFISISFAFVCTCDSPDPDDSIPVTIASVTLQLGSVDVEGAAAFGRIGGLLVDSQGRIFVADLQASEVRVFTPEGNHVFTFGREGSGPGEMIQPYCMAWDPDGLLWLRDGNNLRYNAYRIDDDKAEFVEQRKMAHADGNYWVPLTFKSDGSLIDVGHHTDHNGMTQLVRFFLVSDGQRHPPEIVPTVDPSEIGQHSVVRETPYGQARIFLHQPYGPRQLVAHGPRGTWAHGVSARYSLTIITERDTTQIARNAVAPRLSERELAFGQENMEAQARRVGLPVSQLPFSVPDRKTPIRAIFYDTGGNLWVERNIRDGQLRSADVWSPDGQLMREVRWPSDVTLTVPAWVGISSAVGVRN
ncbi:hypothetical protein ACFL6R_05765, partial [Gemmatimonadota bacterium]